MAKAAQAWAHSPFWTHRVYLSVAIPIVRSISSIQRAVQASAARAYASSALWMHCAYRRVVASLFRFRAQVWTCMGLWMGYVYRYASRATGRYAQLASADTMEPSSAQRRLFLFRQTLLSYAARKETEWQEKRHAILGEALEAAAEEDHVVNTEAEDVEILTSVDSLVSDDGLLPTMVDVLRQQSGTSLERASRFPLQVIGRRINTDLVSRCVPRLAFVPDLRPLSKLAWSTMTDAMADLLRDAPGPLNTTSPDWVFNSVVILLSPSQFGLSKAAMNALHSVLHTPLGGRDGVCSEGVQLNQCLARIRVGQSNAVLGFTSPTCARCTIDVYKTLLCQDPQHSHPSLRHLLDADTPKDTSAVFSPVLVLDLVDVLTPFLLWIVAAQKDWAEVDGSHEALHVVLQYGMGLRRHGSVINLCHQMLLTQHGTCMLLVQFTALEPQCRVSVDSQEILWNVFRRASDEDNRRIRSHLASACEQFLNGDNDVPLDYVRLCAGFVQWMGYGKSAQVLTKAIENYAQSQPEDLFEQDQALACQILKERGPHILSDIIDALWLFVPEERSREVLAAIRRSDRLGSVNKDYKPCPTIRA